MGTSYLQCSASQTHLMIIQGVAMRGGAVVAVPVAVLKVRVPVVLVTVLHAGCQWPVAHVTQRRLQPHT